MSWVSSIAVEHLCQLGDRGWWLSVVRQTYIPQESLMKFDLLPWRDWHLFLCFFPLAVTLQAIVITGTHWHFHLLLSLNLINSSYTLSVRSIWHLKGVVVLLRSPGGDLGAKKKKKKQKRKKEKPSSGGTKSDSASDSQEIKVSALYSVKKREKK